MNSGHKPDIRIESYDQQRTKIKELEARVKQLKTGIREAIELYAYSNKIGGYRKLADLLKLGDKL